SGALRGEGSGGRRTLRGGRGTLCRTDPGGSLVSGSPRGAAGGGPGAQTGGKPRGAEGNRRGGCPAGRASGHSAWFTGTPCRAQWRYDDSTGTAGRDPACLSRKRSGVSVPSVA